MRKNFSYVLAASLAVTGAALLLPTWAADQPGDQPTAQPGQPVQPSDRTGQDMGAGQKMADEEVAKDVRRTLARLVNAGYNPGNFNDLVGYLSKADKDRIGKFASDKHEDLDNQINQFRKDFKAKYNQDFDIKEEQFKDLQVWAGQDKNHATVSFSNLSSGTERPAGGERGTTPGATGGGTSGAGASGGVTGGAGGVGASGGVSAGGTGASGGVTAGSGGITAGGATGGTSGATGGTSGMTGATGGMAATTLNLINEGNVLNAWRVNIPDQLDGQQLKTALNRHISMLDQQKDQWPSDVNQAYKQAAYHLFEALSSSPLATEK